MKVLQSIRRRIRTKTILAAMFVWVFSVYVFFEMEGPQLFKYLHYHYPQRPDNAGQLKHWPFLGVKPVLQETREQTNCELPKLEAANKDFLPFYHPYKPVDCTKLFDAGKNTKYDGVVAFTIRNGRDLHQLVNMNVSCCYQQFITVDPGDGKTKDIGSCVVIRDRVTVIPSGIDFIEVFCKEDGSSQILYHDGLPVVHPPPMLQNGTQINSTSRLNIVVIGLDATSRLNFQRFMPLSRKYLLSPDMSAITLYGYSIVGRATRENLLGLLSGVPSDKMDQRCYHRNGNWNNCSELLWEQASKRGFIINYSEDFQFFSYYYKHSFAKQPTDYYLWPFMSKMSSYRRSDIKSTNFCFGKRLGLQVILDFAQSVIEVAQKENRPHLQLLWSTLVASHDWINALSLGDVHLLDALKKFKKTGVVNNSVIMILGDHGNFHEYYSTPSGSIEYRFPVAHIVLPPWFKIKYPREYSNLVRNSHVRTTPYDMFETMMDIMDLGLAQQQTEGPSLHRDAKGHGISLFQRIPQRRYCNESGIPSGFCHVCHSKIQLDPSDPLVKSAAETVVNKINSLTENGIRSLCQKLGLFKVITAHTWHPKDVVKELCNINSRNGSATCSSFDNVDVEENVNRVAIVDLILTTKPNAKFLTQVRMIWTNNTSLKLKRKPDIMEISGIGFREFEVATRMDRYAETGHCAKQDLKPFCICNIPFKKFDAENKKNIQ